jgi:hypothetical protein
MLKGAYSASKERAKHPLRGLPVFTDHREGPQQDHLRETAAGEKGGVVRRSDADVS